MNWIVDLVLFVVLGFQAYEIQRLEDHINQHRKLMLRMVDIMLNITKRQ